MSEQSVDPSRRTKNRGFLGVSKYDNPYTYGNDHEQKRREGPPQEVGALEDQTPEERWFSTVWKDIYNRYWWRDTEYLWQYSKDLEEALIAPKPTAEPVIKANK